MRGRQLWTLALTALLVGGNVVCFNLLFGKARGARLDLTEDRIFTLAPETIELLQEPEEPCEVFFYYTAGERLHEKLRPVQTLVADTLKEIGASSRGKVIVRLVEWDLAEKAVQDRASDQFGVRPFMLPVQTSDESSVRNTYFAIVVSYGDQFERFEGNKLWRIVATGGDISVEPENIEYLLAKAIHKVVRGFNSVGASLATQGLDASIEFFLSPVDDLPEYLKKVPAHAKKIADKLAAESAGRLKISFEDPTGDAPEKARLREKLDRMGLIEAQLDPTKPGFWAWAVAVVGKDRARIPLFSFGEELTESDVRDAVVGTMKQLVPGLLPIVGIASPEPDEDPMAAMMGRQKPPQEFADIRDILASEFEVRSVDVKSAKPIPRDVSVLLLLRPAGLSERALFELDQFVMRGGRLVVCADPFGFDMGAAVMSGRLEVKRTPLGRIKDLLRHWGAEIDESYLLDTESMQRTRIDSKMQGGRSVPTTVTHKFPYLLFPPPEGVDGKHPLTARLRDLYFAYASPTELAVAVPAAENRPAKAGVPEGVRGAVLVKTSTKASTSTDLGAGDRIAVSREGYSPPPAAREYGLAVALQGRFPSFFADQPIPPAPVSPSAEDPPASRPSEESRVLKSSSETAVVVIGDADFISVLTSHFFSMGDEVRPNYSLLRNALAFGGDAQRLMALRNRDLTRRPLTKLVTMPPAERDAAQSLSRTAAIVAPLLALFGLWLAWFVSRRRAVPPAVAARSAKSEGASS